ncbi:phosphatidylinositol N-acetylglucosaminyltransferase subunit gpi1 [Podila minutissima]|uniref:Phosphatidylinositol N-acetylglucosaminyltransferase subunit gpi1 n=1 Tax=Podila minutissima TaxID=64525 RepID=A0A9P5SED4_9FUNG|nr:phosphatidylinositol N-acetylglucosaminyltransferase subunit gpi1 [Podila minutissima]
MRTYLISAAISFALGYYACNFALISNIYNFTASVPETTHKRYLLYALLILLLLFVLILIPLERIANFEARRLGPLVSALSSLTADPQFAALNQACGVNPVVLGVAIVPFADDMDEQAVRESNEALLASPALLEHKETANLWLTIEIKPTYIPSLKSLHCCGFRYSNVSSEIIFYKQPDARKFQFLSLDPLVLDISQINASGALFDASMSPNAAQKRTKSSMGQARLFISSSGRTVTDDMNVTLQQINYSKETEQAVWDKAEHFLRRRTRSRSMSEAVRDSAVDLSIKVRSKVAVTVTTLWPIIQPFTVRPLMVILFVLRALVEICLWILNLKFPDWVFNGMAIKDMTTTGQQIDLRLQQACFWPWQYFMARKKAWTNTSITRAQYISFYNSMWLVANDIIIGVAFGSFLISNNKYMAEVLQRYVKDYTIDSISAVLEWLTSKNEYPAGLKLNPELNPFLGQLFKWLIEIWADFIISLQPLVPTVINLIGVSGVLGATMSLSLVSDLLAFTTLHIYWFYMVAARIFHWQLTILYSLFNLFRGKKRNTLRHRIDSCDYDLDQLLLGTILFTLLTFLFPTIVVYYLTFTLSRVAVICMQATMETVLACLNHFPLFAILLRLKDPDRLPGGLRLEVCPERYLFLTNSPLPMGAIFFQYSVLWKRLSSHYLTLNVLKCLLSGETIKSIPRLQYPMLPDTRSRFTIHTIKPVLTKFWAFCEETIMDQDSGPLYQVPSSYSSGSFGTRR